MGRELKRVPLDFDWPLDKPWQGFLNPFSDQSIECPHCHHGHSIEYKHLESLWYSHKGGGFKPEMRGSTPFLPTEPLVCRIIEAKVKRDCESARWYGTDEAGIHREAVRMCDIWNSSWSHHLNEQDVAALIKCERLHDFTHIWTKAHGWRKKRPFRLPTPREVNEWSLQGMSHDAINCWVVLKAELKRLKQPSECSRCKGVGHTWPSKSVKWHHDHWKRSQPPKGDGYQIWETVSEGSPISPVFSTPEDLASHMTTTRWGGDKGTSYETWLAFIRGPGWAPSMIMCDGVVKDGVNAVVS